MFVVVFGVVGVVGCGGVWLSRLLYLLLLLVLLLVLALWLAVDAQTSAHAIMILLL